MLETSSQSSGFVRFLLNTINCTQGSYRQIRCHYLSNFKAEWNNLWGSRHAALRFFFFLASLAPLGLMGLHKTFVSDTAAQHWQVRAVASVNTYCEVHVSVAVKLSNLFNTAVVFLLDDLSLFFIGMTVLIISLLILSVDILFTFNGVVFGCLLLLVEYALVGVFASHDFLSFFFFFEATLVPMFLIIILNSSGTNRAKAAYWLAMFTMGSSVFFILPVIWLFNTAGLTTFVEAQEFFASQADGSPRALVLCSLFFVAFAIKVPVMPFHIWLPEVHVEAPTVGSMLLASLLLKLGGYGIVRICLGIFPTEFSSLMAAVVPLLLISLVMSALTAVIQTDTKKIVAYSSIAHMSVALLGLASHTEWGYIGTVVSMFAHSLTSPALFFLVGCLYDRYATRNVMYFGGLARIMPLFSSLLFFFILSNTSFPGFLNFVGEINVIYGLLYYGQQSWVVCSALVVGIVAVTAYNFLLLARLSWGNLNVTVLKRSVDLIPGELGFLVGVLGLLVYWGLYFQPLVFFVSGGLLWA